MGGVPGRAAPFAKLLRNLPPTNEPGVFPKKFLEPGEQLLFETRPSLWGLFWLPIGFFGFWLFVLILGEAVGGVLLDATSAFLDFLFFLPILLVVLVWRGRSYALTSRRVLAVSGMRRNSLRELSVDAVENMTTTQGDTGSMTFESGVTQRPDGKVRRGRFSQRLVWKKIPSTGPVNRYVQEAFAILAMNLRTEQVRRAVQAELSASTLSCVYCGTLVDVREADMVTDRCPGCGAPMSASVQA